jgi:hypothetical protein
MWRIRLMLTLVLVAVVGLTWMGCGSTLKGKSSEPTKEQEMGLANMSISTISSFPGVSLDEDLLRL